MTELPMSFLLTEAVLFGLVMGSFLNVLILRIPQKRSILGRSACPKCGQTIPLYRNIPVLTYLFQGGKGACCKSPISLQYPLIEALSGVLAAAVMLHAQSIPQFFIWYLLFSARCWSFPSSTCNYASSPMSFPCLSLLLASLSNFSKTGAIPSRL